MLTSQTTVRADMASSTTEILGEVRWYDEAAHLLGEISVLNQHCTIGASPNCVVSLPDAGLADIHATLVFGKRFILLKAPHTTKVAGRPIRELLIERTTILQLGTIQLEIIPKSELGQSRSIPRVIRSNELAAQANALSFGDIKNPLNKQTEARLEALESTLGHLQSAIEGIQVASQTAPESEPVDLAAQFAAMSKSLADDLEQRLASRLDSQAHAVDQLRVETIGPIEETLEGLLAKLSDLSAQSERTTDQLANFVAAAESQLSDLFSWREQLETSLQHSPPAEPPTSYDWRQSNESEAFYAPQEDSGSSFYQAQQESPYPDHEATSEHQVGYEHQVEPEQPAEYSAELHPQSLTNYPAYGQSEPYFESEPASPYEQSIEEQVALEQQLEETYYEPQPLSGQAYFLNAPPSEELDSSASPSVNGSSDDPLIDEGFEGIDDNAYSNEYSELSSSPLAAYLKQPMTDYPEHASDQPESVTDEPEFASDEPREYAEQQVHYEPPLDSESFRYSPTNYEELSDSSGDIDDHDLPTSESQDLTARLRQMLSEIQTEEEQLESVEKPSFSVEYEENDEIPESLHNKFDSFSYSNTSRQDEATIELESDPDFLDPDEEEESLPTSFELDRTSILDAPPELPSFDWKQGSLLKTEESETFEQPTSQRLAEGVSNVSSDDSEREESIEEYMQKLLQRVKQGADGADNPGSPLDELTVKSAPRSRSEFMNRAAKLAPVGQPPADSEATAEQPRSETNRRGPTPQVDMNALRELANSNARRAIARSETKRASTTILVKVAVTSFAIASASLILLLNGFQANPPFAGFVAAVVIAVIWGTDCYKHFRSLQRAKAERQRSLQINVEEQKAVRVDDNAESGWRPTPV
ncbi:hypothetical protein SH449x_004741 [Pirellulaceae bacterium SH449]